MAYFDKLLFTNVKVHKEYIYNFLEFYHKNVKFINNNLPNDSYKISKIEVIENLLYVDYHDGVLQFFQDYGYISNIDNPNCKYLVGKMECNEKTLKNNNLYLSV